MTTPTTTPVKPSLLKRAWPWAAVAVGGIIVGAIITPAPAVEADTSDLNAQITTLTEERDEALALVDESADAVERADALEASLSSCHTAAVTLDDTVETMRIGMIGLLEALALTTEGAQTFDAAKVQEATVTMNAAVEEPMAALAVWQTLDVNEECARP